MKMKVSELRPCDKCGGKIYPAFHVVRTSLALIKPQAVNQFMGMHQFFGGRAPAALVENFSPESADAVIVAGDDDPVLMNEFFICSDCFLGGSLDLARLMEKRNDAEKRKEAVT